MKFKFCAKLFILACAAIGAVSFCQAQMSSGSYKINADSINVGGAPSGSGSYYLNDTIGEIATGEGASGTYEMKAGFWYMVNTYLTLTVDTENKYLGTLFPGSPITGETTLDVTTDAWNGYVLNVSKDHKMRHADGSPDIDDHNGSIAMPLLWSAPNNLGFGFTVISGTDVDPKWKDGLNYKYAAFPDVATTVHSKPDYKSSTDETVVGYKVDVPSDQKSGFYSCNVTYTAVGSI
ncbi:MAG: hypothetical protein WC858_04720 [Parcubacteria group bacterium]|jgi:hypothetical protein